MISWTWYFIYDHSFDVRLWWVKPPSSHQCCSQSATFLHHSQPYVHNWWWWCLLSQALYHPSHHARTWSNHLCFDLWRSITWPILYGSLAYQGAQNAPFDSTTTTVILEYKSALCLLSVQWNHLCHHFQLIMTQLQSQHSVEALKVLEKLRSRPILIRNFSSESV